ncbi:hypothetical protein D915_000684 [Fasciola hepatica]|uniref:Centriolin n=1 Tax=Fasciola hepatica TaxID=6192 RepID=A0A4E0S382_FASHE|nr:hypothetical protein D915_000684 [Fasciola hepatica]
MVTYMTDNYVNSMTHGVNPYFVVKLSMSGKGKSHKIKILDLTGNALSSIPYWVCKKLSKLKTIHLKQNCICTLDQLLRLRGLCNLTTLSFLGNPAVDQLVLASIGAGSDTGDKPSKEKRESTYRSYALFHLRTLLILDNIPVQPEEFDLADKRFSQTELSNLTGKLRSQEEQLATMEKLNATLERGLHSHEKKEMEEQAKLREQSVQLKRLECELLAKDQLLKSRSEELARACLKYYELEQELAFHKIDNKLAKFLLGPPPAISPEQLSHVDTTGNFPYLGRCLSRTIPTAVYSQTKSIPSNYSEQITFESDLNNASHLSNRQVESSSVEPQTSTPRSQYVTGAESNFDPVEDAYHQSEKSESTTLKAAIRPNTLKYEPYPDNQTTMPVAYAPVTNDSEHAGSFQNQTLSLSGTQFQSRDEPPEPQAPKVARVSELASDPVAGTTETAPFNRDLTAHSDQLEAERDLALNLSLLHQVRSGQCTPTSSCHRSSRGELQTKTNNNNNNNQKIFDVEIGSTGVAANGALPPPSPGAYAASRNRPTRRERSSSVPHSSSVNSPPTDPVRPDSAGPGCLAQAAATGRTALISESRLGMDYDSRRAHQTQYSGTSSTQSSRTTGTGRSVIPSNVVCQMLNRKNGNGNSEQNASSSESPADRMTESNPVWNSGTSRSSRISQDSRQSQEQQQLNSCSGIRKPGVGLSHNQFVISNALNQSGSPQATHKNRPNSNGCPKKSLDNRTSPNSLSDQAFKRSLHPDRGDTSDRQLLQKTTTTTQQQQQQRQQANNSFLTHTAQNEHSSCDAKMLDQFDELYSSSNQSGPSGPYDEEPCTLRHQTDPLILRTSASGASTSGVVPRRRKHRVIRSVSHMTGGSYGSGNGAVGGGCCTRIHRARGSRAHRSHRRHSSDTIEDQADELMNMLVMSRKACVSEVDKMRSDLACIRQNMPPLYAPCGHIIGPGRNPSVSNQFDGTDNVTHNSVYNVLRATDLNEARLTRSYMESLTNVTRPSPNAPNEGSFFDDEEETNGVLLTENPYNHRSPVRTRPSGDHVHRARGRRLLPAATLLAEEEAMARPEARRSDLRHNLTVCSGQLSPEYQDLRRTKDYGSPIRAGRQSSSIPRDFHRTSSHPTRSNMHCSAAYRGDPIHSVIRAGTSGFLGSPCLGTRPPRGRSLDLSQQQQQRGSHRPRETRPTMLGTQRSHQWIPGPEQMDEEDPSTETAALLNLTEELMGLRQGLKQAKRANANRLEMALRQIGLLELELQRQRCLTHDAQLARDRQAERTRWERRLAATLSELKQCQLNIGEMRAQMDQLATSVDQNSASKTQFGRRKAELEETKSALDAQREEISRLNRLLNQLLGMGPTDTSPNDLAQLQAGLMDLNRKMQSEVSTHPAIFSDPVRRTQSMHTGLAPGPSDPARISNYSMPNGTMGARTTSGNLYCNVPEHHYLEDCMDQLQTRLQESQMLEADQQKKLRQATKSKRKLENQLEEQNATVEQMTRELSVKQDELAEVQDKLKRFSEQTESTQKTDQARLGGLANDMVYIEQAVRERRAELTGLEARLRETNDTLTSVQTQVQEAKSKLNETRGQQTTMEMDLNAVRTELKSSKLELAELRTSVDQTRIQAQKFESLKQELQSSVKQLESTIQSKQDEFKQVSSSVDEVDTKLRRMRAELDAGETRLHSQQRQMAEDEAAMNERRTELRRLSSKIIEDEARLESLAREIGEQRTELELIQAKQQRDLDNVTQDSRDLTTKIAMKQRELAETQSSLNALMDERAQLTSFVESLRAEQSTLQLNLQEKQKTLTDLSATLLRQRRELEHTTDMARLEETRLSELASQQREALDELHKLQSQVRAESHELRGRDVAKLKKNSELQVARTEAEHESTVLERIVAERRSAESELGQLQHQVDLTKNHLNSMRQKVKELEKQEAQLAQAVVNAKRQMNKLSAEREAEAVGLRSLRHERASCQSEYDHLSSCLDASRVELERAQQRLSSAQSAADSQESDLAEQQRQRMQMNDELSRLGESVHMGRLAKQNADEERDSSESALQATREKLEKVHSERRHLDEPAPQQSKKRLASGYREKEFVEAELAKKTALLQSLKEKIKSTESRLTEMNATEARCLDLERRLQEKDRELQRFHESERHTRTKLPGHVHAASTSDLDLARVLEETKAALAASRRDSKRLKRRTARELSELERIAEEQCHRAGELTEQLTLIKRQYAQLKGQISTYGILMDEVITVASQTELSEHGQRLEAALASVRAELEQNLRDEEALFQVDPTIAQTLYGNHSQDNQFGNSDQATSDLHRSLLVLTNSFHDLCHPSMQQQRQQSKPLLTLNDFARSTPGLYRPAATSMAEPGPNSPCLVAEPGESTTGTCRTGNTTATSGLGSSLNPSAAANANQPAGRPSGSEPSLESTVQHGQEGLASDTNELKDGIINRVSKQRQQTGTEWDQSHAQFRAIRDQVDSVRSQLDGTHGSIRKSIHPRGSRNR